MTVEEEDYLSEGRLSWGLSGHTGREWSFIEKLRLEGRIAREEERGGDGREEKNGN